MATISAISSAAAVSTTVTMPTHVKFDVIIASVWRNGSTTAPTVPSGWTVYGTPATSTTCWMGIYYKVAASSSETTGTWTSATSIQVNVYRGVLNSNPLPYGGSGVGSGTTITYPSLALLIYGSTGQEWVFRAAASKSATNMITNVPTSYTARGGTAGVNGIRGCDRNVGSTTPATGTQAVSPTTVWIAWTLELQAAPPAGASFSTFSDDFNTGSTPDAAKWTVNGTAVLTAGALVVTGSAGPTPGYIQSINNYDLTGTSFFIQVKQMASTGGEFYGTDGSNNYGWYFANATTAQTYYGAGLNNSRTHTDGDWYRVRESAGTIYYDTSTNGITWTNFETDAPLAPVNSLQIVIVALDANPCTYDNFNIPGVAASNTNLFFDMF